MEAVLFIGIQATGKSTFYQERFARTHLRLNLDMLKTRHRERQFLSTCLKTQQPFVVDNTNPTSEDRRRYIEPAKRSGFRLVGYYFQSRIDEALERNAARLGKGRVPEAGLRGTYGRLVLPQANEGFDELFYVRIDPGQGFLVEAWQDEV